jgi:hypothetical protein
VQASDGFYSHRPTGRINMKGIGIVIAVIGSVLLVIAINFNTSLEVPGGGTYGIPSRVNNLGLMDERRNYMLVAGLLILCGVLLIGFGSVKKASSEIVPEKENPLLKESPFTQGERALENDAYKIYLVKNYKVDFNETLKSHIFNDVIYKSIDDALVAVRDFDIAKLKREEEEEAARRQWELAKTVPPPNANAVCPNGHCSSPVRHDDLVCWKCEADFSAPNGWRPVKIGAT